MQRFPGYLRVEVTTDNRLLVEEVEVFVEGFGALIDSIDPPPVILYQRANPNAEPPPIFKSVLDTIISRRLPVSLVADDFTRPEYTPPPPP